MAVERRSCSNAHCACWTPSRGTQRIASRSCSLDAQIVTARTIGVSEIPLRVKRDGDLALQDTTSMKRRYRVAARNRPVARLRDERCDHSGAARGGWTRAGRRLYGGEMVRIRVDRVADPGDPTNAIGGVDD